MYDSNAGDAVIFLVVAGLIAADQFCWYIKRNFFNKARKDGR